MANVAAVGQLLEAVGVPAAQVGTQPGVDKSAPATDFATALQAAGGPSGQKPAVRDANGPDAKLTETLLEDAGSTDLALKTANKQPARVAEKAQAGQLASSNLLGRPAARGAGLSLSKNVATMDAVGGKLGETASMGSSERSAGAIAPVAKVATKNTASVVSLSETGQEVAVAAAAAAQVPAQAAIAGAPLAAAAAVKSVDLPAKASAKQNDPAPGVESAKPLGKATVSVQVDSKLTALFPQPAPEISQDVVTVPLAVSAVAVAPPVPVETGAARSKDGYDLSFVTAGPIVTGRGAVIGAAGVKQATPLASADLVAASAPLAVSAPIAARVAATAQEKAPGFAAPAASIEEASPAAPTANVVAGPAKVSAPVSSAAPVPAVTPPATATIAEAAVGASAAVQAAVPSIGLVEATTTKPGVQGGRSTIAPVKTVGAEVPANNVPGAVTPKAMVAGTVAAPAKAAPVVAAAAGQTMVADPTAAPKSTAAPAVSTQGASAVVKVPAETAATPGNAPHASTDAGHPVAAGVQPSVATAVEAGPIVAVTVPAPTPTSHEAAATVVGSASPGSGTSRASSVAAAQDAGLAHTMLSATPTSLEVGVSSGTHGWLKIRAELNAAGTVDASMTGTSPASAERLRTELPGLSNFLQNERVAMGSLDVRSAAHAVVAAGESSATFSQAGSGQGSAGQSFTQANAGGAGVNADAGSANGRGQQQTPQGGQVVPVASGVAAVDEVVLGRASDAALYGSSMELDDNAAASSVGYGTGGGWLNVRA